jgi:hypothetical protein
MTCAELLPLLRELYSKHPEMITLYGSGVTASRGGRWPMNATELLPLVRVYDLRDPTARQAARRHRSFWGKLYTDIHVLDADHVALVFRPAPDERWRAWERVRLRWILEERAG